MNNNNNMNNNNKYYGYEFMSVNNLGKTSTDKMVVTHAIINMMGNKYVLIELE